MSDDFKAFATHTHTTEEIIKVFKFITRLAMIVS